MLFFAKNKLSLLDKKITISLAASSWYSRNSYNSWSEGLESPDENEDWVKLVLEFIEVVYNEKAYRRIIEPAGLEFTDLFSIFIIMTMGTMPNPIIKTGKLPRAHSLIASCIYQEELRQLTPFVNQLRLNSVSQSENLKHKDISIEFANLIKSDVDYANGSANLLECARGLIGR